jgi:hypothetical protein
MLFCILIFFFVNLVLTTEATTPSSLQLHGLDVRFHFQVTDTETVHHRRNLAEDDNEDPLNVNNVQWSSNMDQLPTGDGLIIVRRNYTNLLLKKIDHHKLNAINAATTVNVGGHGRSNRYHRNEARTGESTARTRARLHLLHRDAKTHVEFLSAIENDRQHSLLVIDKNTFVMRARDYVQAEGDLLSPFLAQFKFDPGFTFPLQVKTVPGAGFETGVRLGQDLWALDEPNKIWPDLLTIAQSQNVLWIDKHREIIMFGRVARALHSNRTVPPFLPEGQGITIGLADTGFDPSMCALSDGTGLLAQSQSVVPSSHLKISSLVTSIPGTTDYRGSDGAHGSMTASVAAGYDCGTVVGMATKAKLALFDFTPAGSDSIIRFPSSSTPGIRTFPQWMQEAQDIGGVSVFSFSWGSDTGGTYDTGASTQDYITLRNPTTVVVAAAGNGGGDIYHPSARLPASPCLGKNVICVGAIDGLNPTSVVDFSSYGPLPGSGREKPTVYSPGYREPVGFGYYNPVEGHNDPVTEDGTSFSTPEIAGLIARYQEFYKSWHNGQLPLGPLVHAVLLGSSVPVAKRVSTSVPGKVIGTFNTSTSYGVPMIGFIGIEESYTFDSTNPNSLDDGLAEKAFCYRATGNIPPGLPFAMVYYDHESVGFSSVNLINNLEMKIYIDHVLVHEGQDNANPHERYKTNVGIQQGSTLRVVIYDVDYAVLQTVPFGLYIHGRNLARINTQDCGTCQATEREVCTNSVESKFCNVTSGLMTNCYPVKNVALEGVQTEPCSSEKFVGITVSGQCMPVVCADGYYYDAQHSMCRCVPGFRRTDTQVCDTEDHFVVTTSELDLQDSSQDNGQNLVVQSIGSRAEPSYWLQFVLVIVVTVFTVFF